jgi:stage II sporulation SpoAA-like protein
VVDAQNVSDAQVSGRLIAIHGSVLDVRHVARYFEKLNALGTRILNTPVVLAAPSSRDIGHSVGCGSVAWCPKGHRSMITILDGLPPQVLGVRASGKVTHTDYRDTLIPHAEAMIANGPICLLFVLGKDFAGYEVGALRDDGTFGMRYWRDFRRIAVVGDESRVRTTVSLLKPVAPCEVRQFSRLQLSAANAWVSAFGKVDT